MRQETIAPTPSGGVINITTSSENVKNNTADRLKIEKKLQLLDQVSVFPEPQSSEIEIEDNDEQSKLNVIRIKLQKKLDLLNKIET